MARLARLWRLCADPLVALGCYLGVALSAVAAIRTTLPRATWVYAPMWAVLPAGAVLYYLAYRSVVRTDRVPHPPNPVENAGFESVAGYGRYEARNFAATLLSLALLAFVGGPLFLAAVDAPTLNRLLGRHGFALVGLGLALTAFWAGNRLTAQYLPARSPDLYPDNYTRPLDDPDG